MKQLLTVMVIMLFASFTQGFTVPEHASNSSPNSSLHPNHKWQHTTWFNPWVNVKKANKQAKPRTTIPLHYSFTLNSSYTYYCRLYVNGVLQVDVTSSANSTLNVPIGATVYYEVSVNLNQTTLTTYVDQNKIIGGGFIFYQDQGDTASFDWTVSDQDVIEYYVFVYAP